MILNEQKFTNKSKIFYHGQVKKNSSEKDANFNCFFITNNFMYAVPYTKGRGRDIGVIEKYRLARTINVFNPRNSVDLGFLKKKLNMNNSKWQILVPQLIKSDWIQNTVIDRKKIIKCIKQLGYDGFVNWESIHKDDYNLSFPDYYNNSMSIGVFNKDSLQKIGVLEQKDFASESREFVKAHNDELKYKAETIAMSIKQKLDTNTVLFEVFKSCPTLTWAEVKMKETMIMNAYKSGFIFREVYKEWNSERKSRWDGIK